MIYAKMYLNDKGDIVFDSVKENKKRNQPCGWFLFYMVEFYDLEDVKRIFYFLKK